MPVYYENQRDPRGNAGFRDPVSLGAGEPPAVPESALVDFIQFAGVALAIGLAVFMAIRLYRARAAAADQGITWLAALLRARRRAGEAMERLRARVEAKSK